MRQGRQGQSQLDQLQQANDMATQMYQNLMRRQRRYEVNLRNMDKRQRKQERSRMKEQEKQYKLALKRLKEQYNQTKKYMTREEKEAHKLLYDQRRRDLKRLQQETKRTFKEISEQAGDAADEADERWKEFADNIANMSAGIALTDELTDALQGEQQSLTELKNSIIKETGMTRDDINSLINDDLKSTLDQFDGMFNIEDAMEVAKVLADNGVKDRETMADLVPQILKMQGSIEGLTADNLDKMIQATQQMQIPIEKWGNEIKALENSGLQVNAEGLMKTFEDSYESVLRASNGDAEEFTKRMDKIMATSAVLSDSWGDTTGLMEFLNEVKDADADWISSNAEKMALMGINPMNLQQMMKQGDVDQAMLQVVKGVQGAYSKGNMSPVMENWITQQFGDLKNIQNLDASTLDSAIQTAFDSINQSETTDYMEQTLDEVITSPLTRWMNKFKNSEVGLFLSNLSDETGVDAGDLLIGNALIGNPVGKVLGKAGSKLLGGLGNLFGGGGAGGTGGAGLGLSAMFAGLTDSLGSLAISLGAGNLAGGASLSAGGLAALGAGSVAGGVAGGAGILSGLWDWLKSFKEADEEKKSEKRWQGSTKIGMVGTGAAIGAGIGSVVPVVGTAVGGLIGAGVGGLGALFGGSKVGSWLKGKWDGLWGKNQQEQADKALTSANDIATASMNMGESGVDSMRNMQKELKNLQSTARSTATSYSNSMSKISNSTPNNTGLSPDYTTSSNSDSSNSNNNSNNNNGFKWWNPFTWFGGNDDDNKTTDTGKKATENNTLGSHKNGLDRVPFDGYLAELHEGESVLTKDEAKVWLKLKYDKGYDDIKSVISNNNKLSLNTEVNRAQKSTMSKEDIINKSILGGYVDGSHKNGLEKVPYDGYLAELHKGEAVLTKEEAELWGKMNRQDETKNISDIQSMGGSPQFAFSKGGTASKTATATLHKDEVVLTPDQSRSWYADSTKWFSKLSESVKKQASEAITKFWEVQQQAKSSLGTNPSTDGTTPEDSTYQDLSSADGQGIWKFFRDAGYSKQATAGVMGNLMAESGLKPSNIQSNGKGPAAGIAQWENINTKSARWKQMSDYAKSKGKDWTDLQSQLEFIDMELGGTGNVDKYTSSLLRKKIGGLSQFKALSDIAQATQVFEASFERAGIKAMNKRTGYAQGFYDKYSSYKKGTTNVKKDETAELHKGETVLTKKGADSWKTFKASGMMDQSRSWYANVGDWFTNLTSNIKKQSAEAITKFWEVQQQAKSSLGTDNNNTTDPLVQSTGSGNFPKYSLSESQVKGIARVCSLEQPKNTQAQSAEASLLANLTDFRGDDRATTENLIKKLHSGWFSTSGAYSKSWEPPQVSINAVKSVLVDGKRTLPRYVDNHDCFSDISYVENNGKRFSKTDRSQYKTGVTRIHSRFKAHGTFYTFPSAGSDPFYYNDGEGANYKEQWGDAHYKQGTPWVPDTQVALIHKGEMVVPAEQNPMNKTMKTISSTEQAPVTSDNSDIVDIIKWAVNAIVGKMDEQTQTQTTVSNNYNMSNNRTSRAREVFKF